MFRKPCPDCARLVEQKAAESKKENDILIIGCSHNKVGASVLVNGGLIVGWNLWPANDEDSFKTRANIQLVLMNELMTLESNAQPSDKSTKH